MINSFLVGDIVLLRFPYSNPSIQKKRPAIVLSDTEDGDLILAKITSKKKTSRFDFEITEWKLPGLLLPSVIRLHKIATLEKRLIEKKLGKLEPNDRKEIGKFLVELFNLKK